jgi:tetratricopeptide (TPR) repeat protein
MNPPQLHLRCILALLVVLSFSPAHAASDLGKVDFPTSGSPAAQAHFVRGVAALHSFWYDEAADELRAAQKEEPGFAMAYWGEAMTYNHPIWNEQDRDAALAALQRLGATREERASKAPTEREKAFLDAVEILYGEGDKDARNAAYAAAMRKLHERWPDDFEAASFYALSLIGPALTGPPGDARERSLIQAAAILEELFDRNPQHPGVVHYLIHAYDDPLHAPLGLRAARAYAKVAPAAHHALHMPAHIFVQLGDWASAAASNQAAWAASVDWVKRRQLPIDKQDFHSLSWLAYAYLQQGRYKQAQETLEIARQAARQSDSPRIATAVREMEARQSIETRTWTLAAIPLGPPEKKEGGGYHAGGGMAHGGGGASRLLAIGVGAARSGDLGTAEEAARRLHAMAGGHEDTAVEVMELEVRALVQQARGKADEALKLLAEAAQMEARMAPPSGPPDPLKPAHELYGEVLLEQGRAKEAAEQFEAALLRMPNRAASLLGAARANAKLGNGDAARRYYGQLAAIWQGADPDRPELAEAKGYLEQSAASVARR